MKQVETLEIKRKNHQSRLKLLTKWEELSRASLFAKGENLSMETRRHDLQEYLDKISTCLAQRARMVIALAEVLQALGEVLELLEEG